MDIKMEKKDNNAVVNVIGRLDTNTSGQLEEYLTDLLDTKGEKKLTLDFKELEYISSAGLRVLLGAQKKVNSLEDGDMQITNANSDVKEVFSITGFLDILNVK